ncbi:hypothetical protein [Marinifilum fragile]|uniref:hypothetical protein n=1 Tax=Marinifilum fragile TaxID=570161 RepID=UPI002AA6D52C|nr:hypothetical protein [Marinifilum fragile]
MQITKEITVPVKHQLDSLEEILEHIEECSVNEINLDECQLNIGFNLNTILQELKKRHKFSDKISLIEKTNESGFKVCVCLLKIPFRSEATVYKKGAYFESIIFYEYAQFVGSVFESDYSFKKSFFESSVNFSMAVFKIKTFSRCDQFFFRTTFKEEVSFMDTIFYGLAFFGSATFTKDVDIRRAEFGSIDLADTEMKENTKLVHYETAKFHKVNNRITGLYLKQYAQKMNDSVSMLLFKELEMDAYRKYLFSFESLMDNSGFNKFRLASDIFILTLNKLSNSHGTSFFRGVLFTMAVWGVFFSWFVMVRDGVGNAFIWTNGEYLNEAVNYLWLFNGLKGLTTGSTVLWSCIIPFLLGKIFIAYGIYQTISAFRKYLR